MFARKHLQAFNQDEQPSQNSHLDRCQNDFVVEFLEGIQTSFRHEKVAYVVAADKFWIRTSFEEKYQCFCEKTADRTQPLGYQFMEKIFQFNVALPGMAAWKKRYLEARLDLGEGKGNVSAFGSSENSAAHEPAFRIEGSVETEEVREDEQIARFRDTIRSEQPEGVTYDALRTLPEEAKGYPAYQAYQAALAMEYTVSKKARREAEHFLFQYLELLPDNPRMIKRIINSFGMAVATSILEQQTPDLEQQIPDHDVLTRWTILTQCYPAVADVLTRDPDLVEVLLSFDAEGGEDLAGMPESLVAFCAKKKSLELLKNGETAVLTSAVIKKLTQGYV